MKRTAIIFSTALIACSAFAASVFAGPLVVHHAKLQSPIQTIVHLAKPDSALGVPQVQLVRSVVPQCAKRRNDCFDIQKARYENCLRSGTAKETCQAQRAQAFRSCKWIFDKCKKGEPIN